MLARRDVVLLPRLAGRHEDDLVEIERLRDFARRDQVTVVDGVERPTHDPDSRGCASPTCSRPSGRAPPAERRSRGLAAYASALCECRFATLRYDSVTSASAPKTASAMMPNTDRLERDVAVCSDSSAARARSVARVIRAPFGFASWCNAVFSLCGQAGLVRNPARATWCSSARRAPSGRGRAASASRCRPRRRSRTRRRR